MAIIQLVAGILRSAYSIVSTLNRFLSSASLVVTMGVPSKSHLYETVVVSYC